MIENRQIKQIEEQVDKYIDVMKRVSDFLFKNPEIGGEEYIASKYLVDIAAKMGFRTVENYCGLDTAFMAEFQNGQGPVLAVVAEYDALPGFGPAGSLAHACGHNWISAVGIGTAMIMSALKDEFSGTLRILGTPAMENLGCKAEMIKAHAFDDIDVVIQSHLEHYTTVASKFLALDAMEFTFRGRASHASSSPEKGINALDAVQFMFMGVNALRPYLGQGVKIHGVISDGGETPSVIPDMAVCKYYIRADSRKQLEAIKPKIIRCAEGAAMMAGAEMTMSYFENPHDDMLNLPLLQKIAEQYIVNEGIRIDEDYESVAGFSSADIGNVSHVCPTLYMEFDVEADKEFRVHDKIALNYVNSKYSTKKLRQVSKIMAEVLMELYNNNGLIEEIKKEHGRLVREKAVGESKMV